MGADGNYMSDKLSLVAEADLVEILDFLESYLEVANVEAGEQTLVEERHLEPVSTEMLAIESSLDCI